MMPDHDNSPDLHLVHLKHAQLHVFWLVVLKHYDFFLKLLQGFKVVFGHYFPPVQTKILVSGLRPPGRCPRRSRWPRTRPPHPPPAGCTASSGACTGRSCSPARRRRRTCTRPGCPRRPRSSRPWSPGRSRRRPAGRRRKRRRRRRTRPH